jgi:hypothetical protein
MMDFAGLPYNKQNVTPGVSASGTSDSQPARDERSLRVRYRNHRGETAERTITPWGIEWGSTDFHPEPQWLLTCLDHDRHAARTYALKDCDFAAHEAALAAGKPADVPSEPVSDLERALGEWLLSILDVEEVDHG